MEIEMDDAAPPQTARTERKPPWSSRGSACTIFSPRPFDIRSVALTGLFLLAIFYTMYFVRSLLLPIVLALLLSYLLRPIVRGWRR